MTQGTSQPTRDQVREQVRQTIELAREAAREAAIQDGQIPPVPPTPPIEGMPPMIGQPTIGFPHDEGIPDIPPNAMDVSIAFFIMIAVCVVGYPLARALGRRIEGRAERSAAIPGDLGAQLQRIEHAVESTALEVERISEAQRYLTRLQSEPLPRGARRDV